MSTQSGHPTLAHSMAPPTMFTLDRLSMTALDSTLLDYVLTTSPDPLVASASLTEPTNATLSFVVSCPIKVKSANVAQIVIVLPVRDPRRPEESSALAMVAPQVVSIVSSGDDQWSGAPGAAPGVFTFTPKGGGVVRVSTQSLTITFPAIEISELVGTAEITIREWAAHGTPPSPPQDASATGMVPVTKFPPGFYFYDLKASAAAVERGGSVTLTWNSSSNAACTLIFNGQNFPVSGQSRLVTNLTGNTMFQLDALAAKNGQTVSRSMQTFVQVFNPFVIDFHAEPPEVAFANPRQQVELKWLASEDADGAYLLKNGARLESLKRTSDDNNQPKKKITPQPGERYHLQAYRKVPGQSGAETEILSLPWELIWSFLPLGISFSADRTAVSNLSPSTHLTWDVTSAELVTLQGAPVNARDSQPKSPLEHTTYTLEATGAYGKDTKTVTVKSYRIGTPCYTTHIDYSTIDFNYGRDHIITGFTITLTVNISVAHANSVSLDVDTKFTYSAWWTDHSIDGDASLVGDTWQRTASLYHLGPPAYGPPDSVKGPFKADIYVDTPETPIAQLPMQPCAHAPASLMAREAFAVRAPGSTLLTYVMTTLPDPLHVSPSLTEPAAATLRLVISCPLVIGSANVSQIVLALPVRDPSAPNSSELAMVAPPRGCISIVSTGTEEWIVAPGAAPGVFTFTPRGGTVALAAQSLTITFAGIEISALVGTAAVAISEWAAVGTPPSPPQPASATGIVPVTKYPPGFFATNLAASAAQVDSGGAVTLTWSASSDAACVLEYDQRRFPVSGRSWTSPPLHATTVFILRALGAQNGQTVGRVQTTTVRVANPIVVSFQTLPNQVSYGQLVALTWLSSDADGVYLLTGTAERRALPAAPDANNPVKIILEPGGSYALQAYRKGVSGGEIRSQPYPLEFTFLPVDFRSFRAEPAEVSDAKPYTRLSWDIANAVAVAFQGTPVDAVGTHMDAPRDDTIYTIEATWVDGSKTTRTVSVKSHKIRASIRINEQQVRHWQEAGASVMLNVIVTVVVAARSVILSPLTLRVANGVAQTTVKASRVGGQNWQANAPVTIDFQFPNTSLPNVSAEADILVDGRLVRNVGLQWG
jgi:hypothetical protein